MASSLIETSQRPISTDGCHMYANKEQSESRSPISTTCLPHTATTTPPVQHLHTHTYPPNPFRGTSLFFPIYSCILIRVKTLIIVLFFFKSAREKKGNDNRMTEIQADASRIAKKGSHQLFSVFVEGVPTAPKCGLCGQGAPYHGVCVLGGSACNYTLP